MYIKSIKINNFKGFENTSIEFHPKLNVFIGSNASGKTTLLNAITKAIYSLTEPFASVSENSELLVLSENDINYNSNSCYVDVTIADFPDYQIDLDLVVAKTQPGTKLESEIEKKKNAVHGFINWYRSKIQQSLQTVPIFKFYPANRGSIAYVQTNVPRVFEIPQLEAWSNIYQSSFSYSRFFNWFFDNETNELRLQRDAMDFNIESSELKGVRKALSEAFERLGHGKAAIKTKQIKRPNSSKLTPTLIVENLKTKKIDEVDNKSDGEKAVIALIADIAYNLSLAKNFRTDAEFLNSPGVVLIDEIESHLHPNWQRTVISVLTELFPHIQFFIATHSPQVVSDVNSESIYLCQDFRIEKINLKTLGEDTNTLLKYIFNSTDRPRRYIELIDRFYKLIENKSKYEAIEAVLDDIRKLEQEDKGADVNSLIEELKLEFEAYKYDRKYEVDR